VAGKIIPILIKSIAAGMRAPAGCAFPMSTIEHHFVKRAFLFPILPEPRSRSADRPTCLRPGCASCSASTSSSA
jgi:hypothetical protein